MGDLMLKIRLILVSLTFCVLFSPLPGFAQGLPNEEDCAAAVMKATNRYSKCVNEIVEDFMKDKKRDGIRAGYGRCDAKLERKLSRVGRRFRGQNCPDLSPTGIQNRVAAFVIAEYAKASGVPTPDGLLPGVAEVPSTTCTEDMTITFENLDYSYIKIAVNPGGLSSDIDTSRAYPDVPNGQTFNGQVWGVSSCQLNFDGTISCFHEIECESGLAFTADNRNGCDQSVSVSCTPGAGYYGISFALEQINIPGGSWWETCDEASFDGTTLCAWCSNDSNAARDNYSCQACSSGLWGNQGGQLACDS